MVKVIVKENGFFLPLSEKEFKYLELDELTEYELLKARKGLYILVEKKLDETQLIDKKIFSLLKSKPLKELVEGKFEKLLSKKELERLQQLVKEGRIIKFKLSKKYAKAVYRAREEIEKKKRKFEKIENKEKSKAKEAMHNTFALQRDGFQVIENEEEARNASQIFEEEIRQGLILGLKAFDGKYYVIKKELLDNVSKKIIGLLKEKQMTLQELSEKARLNESLVKTVCEILKEQGEITEKRKQIYAFIP